MIYRNEHTVQKSWKIIYSKFEGFEEKTVKLLNTELSRFLTRADGVNTIYVLPCEKEGTADFENAFVVGLYDESEIIRSYVKKDEVPNGGFCVKVVNKKKNGNRRLVLITAFEPIKLYYGAVKYLDDYANSHSPTHGALKYPEGVYESVTDEYFDKNPQFRMAEWSFSDAPKLKERGIFCWGQTINNFRNYFTNLARLRINRAVLWNTYMPLNAKEIEDFADSLGIKVIWGFAWGWDSNMARVTSIEKDNIKALEDKVIALYEKEYLPLGVCDIYFQSFTEVRCDNIGDRNIASVVTDFVNETARKLWEKYPDLNIRFGLHAMSVSNHLSEIARVDKRIEIIWEDCGEFPFSYTPVVKSEADFNATCNIVKKMLELREGAKTGFMLKGFATSDWSRFEEQAGPFILGENSEKIVLSDKCNRRGNWKIFGGQWLKYGRYAQRMIDFINKLSNCGCGLYLVGVFDGGIYLSETICADMFWNCDEEFEDILMRAAQRDYITEL